MPRESVGMSTIVVRCYRATVLLLKVPNVLCAALQVAAIVLMYYMQCYGKLRYNVVIHVVMHSTIVLLVLRCRALHKGPGL